MTLGIGMGVLIGVVIYLLLEHERQQRETAQNDRALSSRPQHEIVLPPAEKKQAIEPARLKLRLTALPVRFTRREEGAIIAETLPGTACTIDAVYSTNRRPNSLVSVKRTAEADGACRWNWEIGTSGTYVDVTVIASLDGYEEVKETLRVEVID